ncbi:IFR1 [[Candida] subhashii]|uniref:IFR1 n=1 Tax=[Candida] subhashii TaxID=561895 RepID=A0A8J5UJ88_9ASCO|nr:IFR1 [[Candida] subhashii]KAG7661607.1 IFR1 [[Candida] subhashii]
MKAVVYSGHLDRNSSKIKEVPIPTIKDNQILIKTIACALNPFDFRSLDFQEKGAILGCDASGIVVEVGEDIEDFKVGDHVSTFINSFIVKDIGAFAEYVIGHPSTTIKYDHLSEDPLPIGRNPSTNITTFEAAASITLSMATVVNCLVVNFQIPFDKELNKDKYILIWAGTTSSGGLAIQLAKLIFGLKVVTTALPRHFEYVKSLGADEVFDYQSPSLITDIQEVVKGKIEYAFDTVGTARSIQMVYDTALTSISPVSFENLDFFTEANHELLADRKDRFFCSFRGAVWGDPLNESGANIGLDDEAIERFRNFWDFELGKVIKEIKTLELVVMDGGLESVHGALEYLREDKIRAEKLVFRI